jgi:inorganic triphosphatase YgiF
VSPNRREIEEAISYIREALSIAGELIPEDAEQALQQALEFLGADDEEED